MAAKQNIERLLSERRVMLYQHIECTDPNDPDDPCRSAGDYDQGTPDEIHLGLDWFGGYAGDVTIIHEGVHAAGWGDDMAYYVEDKCFRQPGCSIC
jgi:hypothetical protein